MSSSFLPDVVVVEVASGLDSVAELLSSSSAEVDDSILSSESVRLDSAETASVVLFSVITGAVVLFSWDGSLWEDSCFDDSEDSGEDVDDSDDVDAFDASSEEAESVSVERSL
jgi:hypothetical protein